MTSEMTEQRSPTAPRWFAMASAFTIAVFLAVVGGGLTRYGSIPAALAAGRGDYLFVSESTKSLGEMVADRPYEAIFTVRNLSSQPVSIVGYKSSCTCTAALDRLPLVVPPRGSRLLTVTAAIRPAEDRLSQTVALRSNRPEQPELVLGVAGRRRRAD